MNESLSLLRRLRTSPSLSGVQIVMTCREVDSAANTETSVLEFGADQFLEIPIRPSAFIDVINRVVHVLASSPDEVKQIEPKLLVVDDEMVNQKVYVGIMGNKVQEEIVKTIIS